MTAPDLTDKRTQAEAVAYGKLLATRAILDALAKNHPSAVYNPRDYVAGYERAVVIAKATRLGVEQPTWADVIRPVDPHRAAEMEAEHD